MLRNTDSYIPARLFELFSEVALQIQLLSRQHAMDRFHDCALDELQRLLPFDKAWWGRAAMINGMPEEHSCHLYRLPATYVSDWRTIRHDDVTVDLVNVDLGRSAVVDTRASSTPAGLRWLGERHGYRELVCVVHKDPKTQLVDHLTLYRAPGAERFDSTEQLLLEALMPHMVAAVSNNQIRTLVTQRERLSGGQNLALGVCDQFGILQCTEQGFVDLLAQEWPDWHGPGLPFEPRVDGYQGSCLEIDISPVADLYLLTVRARTVMARLSARERDVALRFGEGSTYKQVARELGMAPNTVRHHIRSIYSKLGITGKASISHLLHQYPPI